MEEEVGGVDAPDIANERKKLDKQWCRQLLRDLAFCGMCNFAFVPLGLMLGYSQSTEMLWVVMAMQAIRAKQTTPTPTPPLFK